MAETAKFALPLLAAAQAQKHVTVNEALLRIDAMTSLVLEGFGTVTPPGSPAAGACYLVGAGASGAWAGQTGKVAIEMNGGWEFVTPPPGLRAWDKAGARVITLQSGIWVAGALAVSAGGAAGSSRAVEIDHVMTSGATNTTAALFPSHGLVLGVTARVISAITGTGIGSFSIGVAADPQRYGSGIGLGLNAWSRGVTGTPVAYYADTSLVLTADAGTFGGGTLRLTAHVLELTPPASV